MSKQWKLLGAMMVAGALCTSAFAQTAATSSSGSDATNMPSSADTKAEKKSTKKHKSTKMKRDRNTNGADGPAETSSKPQPAAGTGSQ